MSGQHIVPTLTFVNTGFILCSVACGQTLNVCFLGEGRIKRFVERCDSISLFERLLISKLIYKYFF